MLNRAHLLGLSLLLPIAISAAASTDLAAAALSLALISQGSFAAEEQFFPLVGYRWEHSHDDTGATIVDRLDVPRFFRRCRGHRGGDRGLFPLRLLRSLPMIRTEGSRLAGTDTTRLSNLSHPVQRPNLRPKRTYA